MCFCRWLIRFGRGTTGPARLRRPCAQARMATLTTEALALASGGDRRAIGAYSLMQTGAALIPFALALLIPAFVWRNRKGLRNG